jgi:lambda family phage portal protein
MSDELYNTIYGSLQQVGYEGSSTSYRRELSGIVYGTSDNIAARELLFLQLRSAHAIRNNGYAKAAQKKYVENLKAVKVNWKDAKGKKHARMQDLWDEFAANPSLDGYGTLDNIQSIWNSSIFQSGSAHTRYQIRRTGNANKIPLKLDLIQSETHDIFYNGQDGIKDIRTGIEFEDSKPVNYFYRRGLVDTSVITGNSPYERVTISADEILHMFIREYPNQWIGIPFLSSVLIPLYELDELSDATVAKQKAAQAISWIVKGTNTGNSMPVGAPGKVKDNAGNDKIVFKANGGNVQYLNKGEDIAFYQSTDVGANLLPFINSELRRVASAVGLPYFQLTGDYSGIDFSTLRGIAIELRNRIEFIHNFYTIPLGLHPLCTKFKGLATLYNSKVNNAYPSFQLPRWYGVDGLKDAQEDVLEIQNGIGTLEKALDERHLTFEEVVADREKITELGLDNLLYPNGKPMAQVNNSSANTNSTGNA